MLMAPIVLVAFPPPLDAFMILLDPAAPFLLDDIVDCFFDDFIVDCFCFLLCIWLRLACDLLFLLLRLICERRPALLVPN